MNMPGQLDVRTRRAWAILRIAVRKFRRIEGAQLAGAFAYFAFFSLFPLIIIFVTIAAGFVDRDRAAMEIIAYIETYVPITSENQSYIFDTIGGVVGARGWAGAVALLMLVWVAMRLFSALISATNQAWGLRAYGWLGLPLKSLLFLVIMVSAVLLAVLVPVLAKVAKAGLFPRTDFGLGVYLPGRFLIPVLVMFLGLSVFYRLAPRRPTRFAEVWGAALFATGLLQAAETLFVVYLEHFSTLNAVYGAFGGIMALLLWIYTSGWILIFGACLCAALAERRSVPTATTMSLGKGKLES